MSLANFEPIPIGGFRGLMTLPGLPSQVPADYAIATQNCAYPPGAVTMRPGASRLYDMGPGALGGNGVSHFEIFRQPAPAASYYVFLASNVLYASLGGGAPATLIGDCGGAVHFRLAQYGANAFITLSNGQYGVGAAPTSPYIWTPASGRVSRMCLGHPAGTVPVATLALGAGGNCSLGVHRVAVLFETASGFRSFCNVSPAFPFTNLIAFASINVTAGNQTINVTNVPRYGTDFAVAGYSNTDCVKRHLCMTGAGLLTYFIVTTIADNTSTTGTINIDDFTLASSPLLNASNYANYWDVTASASASPSVIQNIPRAGAVTYGSRLVTWGDPGNRSALYISDPDAPESVNASTGFIIVNRDDGQAITNCWADKYGPLYITKDRAIWAVEDNGDVPANWAPPRRIVPNLGSISLSGVDYETDDMGVVSSAYILNEKGLYKFDGAATELSKNIRPTWKALNSAKFNAGAEVRVDAFNKRIYCLVPGPGQNSPDRIMVMDYQDDADPKWDTWIPATNSDMWTSIQVDGNVPLIATAAGISGAGGRYVRTFDPTANYDAGGAGNVNFSWFYRTGAIAPEMRASNMFGGVAFEATGIGTLNIKYYLIGGSGAATSVFFNGRMGDISTNGNAVTWLAGDLFTDLQSPMAIIIPGQALTFPIAVVNSPTSITLGGPGAGVLPLARYYVQNALATAPQREYTAIGGFPVRAALIHLEFGQNQFAAGQAAVIDRVRVYARPDGSRPN